MKFQTEVELPRGYEGLIDHTTPVATLGSCFADEVGARLAAELFDVAVNPFGPLFNPASIEHTLEIAADSGYDPMCAMTERDGRVVSLDFHSRLSASTPEELAARIVAKMAQFRAFLEKNGVVTLTLGTSRVFIHRRLGRVVANCQKLPAREFDEAQLGVAEVAASLGRSLDILRRFNPGVKVVVTVSPVRHGGHSLHADRLSKARLLLGADSFAADNPGAVIYFPAYEIVNDQLRDYRYYAADMMHPSPVAVDFIYEQFGNAFFSDATRRLAADCRKFTTRLAHRPLAAPKADRHDGDPAALAATFTTIHPEVSAAVDRYIAKLQKQK